MNRRRLALRTIVGRLAAASDDPEVVGLLARLGSTSISLAQAQELSDAIMRFRRKGKEAIAWAETFGELGRGHDGVCRGDRFWRVVAATLRQCRPHGCSRSGNLRA